MFLLITKQILCELWKCQEEEHAYLECFHKLFWSESTELQSRQKIDV